MSTADAASPGSLADWIDALFRIVRRDNPTKRHLEALAQYFDVPVAYFFDDDQGAAIARELELPGALRDAGVRSVALRAVNLSPEGVNTISDTIDVLARREGAGGARGDGGPPGETVAARWSRPAVPPWTWSLLGCATELLLC
ncbi:XRE family transcriptional regulator [Streptomyces sp. NPDC048288]|uniref:XRE family transcriptional regulator n=1 Tax=Streptomyces sp. NPDC048288 TaxID=3365529 RepID=UPI0037225527